MKEQVEIFKALSDESRLRILRMLSSGELCACDIQDKLNLTQPTISHHMKVLQQAQLVEYVKRGKWIFYTVSLKRIEEVTSFLKQLTTEKLPLDLCIASNCDCDGERCKR